MFAIFIAHLLELASPGFKVEAVTEVGKSLDLFLRIQDLAEDLNIAKWASFAGAYPALLCLSYMLSDKWFAMVPVCCFLAALDAIWLMRQRRTVRRKILMRIGDMLDNFFEELAGTMRVINYSKIQATILGNLEAGFSPADVGRIWNVILEGGKIGCMYCTLTGSKWGVTAVNLLTSVQRTTVGLSDTFHGWVMPLKERMASTLLNRAGLGYRSMNRTCRRTAAAVLPYAPIAGGILGSMLVAGVAVISAKWVKKPRKPSVTEVPQPTHTSVVEVTTQQKDGSPIAAVVSQPTPTSGPVESKKSSPTLIKSGKSASGRYWAYDDEDEQYLIFQGWEGLTRVGPNNKSEFYQWLEGQEDDTIFEDKYAEEAGGPSLTDIAKRPVETDAWTRDTFKSARAAYVKKQTKKSSKLAKPATVTKTETQQKDGSPIAAVVSVKVEEAGPSESSLGKTHLDVSKLPMARLVDKKHGVWQNAPVVQAKLLVNKHTLNLGKESSEWAIQYNGKEAPVQFGAGAQADSKANKDIVFLAMPKLLSGVKSASLRFSTSLSKKEGASATLVGYFGDDVTKPHLSAGTIWRGDKYNRHTCCSGPGSCGSYLVDMDGASPAIVGFHSHGDDGTKSNGYYPVTSDLLNEMTTLRLVSKN